MKHTGLNNTTHQYFNNDIHAKFNVMADPIPIISFYWNQPVEATNWKMEPGSFKKKKKCNFNEHNKYVKVSS